MVSVIAEIKTKIQERDYYLSSHAEEEMVEDGFERKDVEYAILHGRIYKKLTHDPRGTRYQILGAARNGIPMYVICRFREKGSLIIITVYKLENHYEM
ncbi:MAG: DUF4258 domain-containing protein [Verrucomicrobiae bacterium]|nr:DUF4258 domain-containing protein [Verrucomicrobiae bacterium]